MRQFFANCDFLKSWSSPNNWQYFGLIFAEANFIRFHLNKQFQGRFCCRYFYVSKVVWCRWVGLSNRALMQIFCHFWAWTLFSKSRWIFSPSSGHPVNNRIDWTANRRASFWWDFRFRLAARRRPICFLLQKKKKLRGRFFFSMEEETSGVTF